MFVYKGKKQKLISMKLLSNSIKNELCKELQKRIDKFKCSNINGQDLCNIISQHWEKNFEIKTYWYWRRSVNGMFDASTPNCMYINTRGYAYNGDLGGLVSLAWHEYVHYLDYLQDEYYFHHESNAYRTWKEETAPYYTDYLAEKIINNEATDRERAEKVIYYIPWYKRLWRGIKSIF